MTEYLISFQRETLETVRVHADNLTKALAMVEETHGQDPEVCHNTYYDCLNLKITSATEVKLHE